MVRRFFVIGDIEMGGGDLMDDFHDDALLVKFVEMTGRAVGGSAHADERAGGQARADGRAAAGAHVTAGEERHAGSSAGAQADEVVLILNGDVFDFLKMDYRGKYPRHITEEISEWKMKKVLQAHPRVFAAWKKFLEIPQTRLVFVIGNHDADVAWPGVQRMLLEALGHPPKITITHFFENKLFHVQHGNLIDPFFGFNHLNPVIEHQGKKILNLPLGAQIAAQYLTPFKAKFHKQEVLYPQHEVIRKYPQYKKEMRRLMLRHGFKIFVADPLMKRHDPMYRVPYGRVWRHFWRHGFDGVHDDRFMNIRELETRFGKSPVYVLSHSHIKKDVQKNGSRYIFVDCWRTERDVRTPDLRKKPKTYVEITQTGDKLAQVELKEFQPA
jgi:hypothetical protein